MKVWVVMPTDYDEYGINGIFDSLEAAKAANPGVEWHPAADEWVAEGDHLCIYAETVQTLEGIREKERLAAEARSPEALAVERERLRAEVRVPLPYE